MSAEDKDKKHSPSTEVGEDSESEYSTSEDTAAARDSLLFGNMKTRLRWDTDSKTMHLDVRQLLQSRRKMQAKYKGQLDTSTGQYHYTAQLQRLMSQNTPSLARVLAAERGMLLEGEDAINPDRFLPAGLKTLLFKDWNVAPGVRWTSTGRAPIGAAAAAGPDPAAAAAGPGSSSNGSGALRYCLTLAKQPQVVLRRGVWDSWLDGKVDVELSQAQQQVGLRAGLKLKVMRLNVTDKQDIQVAVGYDYITDTHSSSASWSSSVRQGRGNNSSSGVSKDSGLTQGVLTPYLRLSETSWAVRLSKGSLAFTYEM